MARPTKSDLLTLDYASDGQPFVRVAAKDTIDTAGLDVASDGQPFVAAGAGGGAPDPDPPSARPVCFVCT